MPDEIRSVNPRRINVELHCHSVYSKDGLISFESLVKTAGRVGLDAIAITDHDTIEGAREFQRAVRRKELPLQIIAGEEKTLQDGTHFIGLFLEKPIESGDLANAIAEIREQGGLCLVPHPFRRKDGLCRNGLDRVELLQGVSAGFELFNAKCAYRENILARELLTSSGLCPFGGSDAHYESDLGESMNVVHWEGDLKTSVERMFRRERPFEILGKQQTPASQERAYAPLYYRLKKFISLPRPFLPGAKQCYRWYRNARYGVGLKTLTPLYSNA
jgi:predicted metal-dependent phosphoesterase TrpH